MIYKTFRIKMKERIILKLVLVMKQRFVLGPSSESSGSLQKQSEKYWLENLDFQNIKRQLHSHQVIIHKNILKMASCSNVYPDKYLCVEVDVIEPFLPYWLV